MQGTFDITIASLFGSAADGNYKAGFSSCCRVSGIVNATGSNTTFEARARRIAGVGSGSPQLNSQVATGIAKGYEYRQNLNASDPDGGALTYTSLAGQPDGPTSDVVTYEPDGDVVIPASTTSGFTNGQFYVYKVRVVDPQGDYAERDVLLTVTDQNDPPVFSGIPSSSVQLEAGQTQVINISATDPNAGNVVTISSSTLPAWISFSQTSGNPAQATLTISPPLGTAVGAVGVNLDAVDNHNTAPLTASANFQVQVMPAKPVLTSAPAEVSSDPNPAFSFTGTGGVTFECRMDGGSWSTCTAPYSSSGLADGQHTFEVRAKDPGSVIRSASTVHVWTVDTTPPAASILAAPASTTTDRNAQFTFASEVGVTFECRVDGGAWQPCTSPQRYAGLAPGAHRFEVRATDGAGNVGPAAARDWTIGSGTDKPTGFKGILPAGTVSGGTKLSVGCALDKGALHRCKVRAYVLVKRGGKLRKVFIGKGRVRLVTKSSGSAKVTVRFTRRGRRLLARKLGGVKVRFEFTGFPFDGKVQRKVKRARVLPRRQVAVPVVGLFDFDSTALNRKGALATCAGSRARSAARS